jgi:hypothetical protein
MAIDHSLDVPFVARLRPAALGLPAGHLGALVGNRHELAQAEPVDVATLAPDVRDQRTVATTDEPHERER